MSIAFERAKKTFLGFLQARGKAWNTIRNYASDLQSFGEFCSDSQLDFQKLALKDLESYHFNLKKMGLSANSRRRKLLTAKGFLKYLSGRMDVSVVGSEKLVAPDKVEKTPQVLSLEQLEAVFAIQPPTEIGLRNRALLGVLVDTGMLVTECLNLRFEDFTFGSTGGTLQIQGKRARGVAVSLRTAQSLQDLQNALQGHALGMKKFFHGYSKAGPKTEKLTPRAVEMLFQSWAKLCDLKHLHPRSLRHFYVVRAIGEGRDREHIMRVLGLKTVYAFRVYEPFIAIATNAATYKEGVSPAEVADRLKWADSIKKELRKERRTHKDSDV